jgi:hypothetical protein
MQYSTARVAKYIVNALFLKATDDNIGSGEFHGKALLMIGLIGRERNILEPLKVLILVGKVKRRVVVCYSAAVQTAPFIMPGR